MRSPATSRPVLGCYRQRQHRLRKVNICQCGRCLIVDTNAALSAMPGSAVAEAVSDLSAPAVDAHTRVPADPVSQHGAKVTWAVTSSTLCAALSAILTRHRPHGRAVNGAQHRSEGCPFGHQLPAPVQ